MTTLLQRANFRACNLRALERSPQLGMRFLTSGLSLRQIRETYQRIQRETVLLNDSRYTEQGAAYLARMRYEIALLSSRRKSV